VLMLKTTSVKRDVLLIVCFKKQFSIPILTRMSYEFVDLIIVLMNPSAFANSSDVFISKLITTITSWLSP
jgi:hypothetical protein